MLSRGCSVVFDRRNVHVVKGATGELIKKIMKKVEQEDSDDIVMIVPLDEKH